MLLPDAKDLLPCIALHVDVDGRGARVVGQNGLELRGWHKMRIGTETRKNLRQFLWHDMARRREGAVLGVIESNLVGDLLMTRGQVWAYSLFASTWHRRKGNTETVPHGA